MSLKYSRQSVCVSQQSAVTACSTLLWANHRQCTQACFRVYPSCTLYTIDPSCLSLCLAATHPCQCRSSSTIRLCLCSVSTFTCVHDARMQRSVTGYIDVHMLQSGRFFTWWATLSVCVYGRAGVNRHRVCLYCLQTLQSQSCPCYMSAVAMHIHATASPIHLNGWSPHEQIQ